MTEPNQVELEKGTKTVQLAGKNWPIPQLAPRQNRVVVPALMKVLPDLMAIKNGDISQFDTELYSLLLDISFHALTRAHKELTRNEFEDMPITTEELILASEVVADATGVIKKKPVVSSTQSMQPPDSPTGTQ